MEILIIDDESCICDSLERSITDYLTDTGQSVDINIKKYTNVEYLLTYLEDGIRPDAIFMDIKLNRYNGIELAVRLQQMDAELTVVFITGFIEYSKDIFDAKPFDFLVKPLSRERVWKVMDRLLLNEQNKTRQIITVQEKDTTYFLDKKDVIYVEAALKYTYIHTTEKVYKTKTMFSIVEDEMKDFLVKCHRSYMVNPSRIKRMENMQLYLTNGDMVPVARPRKKEVYNRLGMTINT